MGQWGFRGESLCGWIFRTNLYGLLIHPTPSHNRDSLETVDGTRVDKKAVQTTAKKLHEVLMKTDGVSCLHRKLFQRKPDDFFPPLITKRLEQLGWLHKKSVHRTLQNRFNPPGRGFAAT